MNSKNVAAAIKNVLTKDFDGKQFDIVVGKTEEEDVTCDIRCIGRSQMMAAIAYNAITAYLEGLSFDKILRIRVTDKHLFVEIDGGVAKKVNL